MSFLANFFNIGFASFIICSNNRVAKRVPPTDATAAAPAVATAVTKISSFGTGISPNIGTSILATFSSTSNS